MKLIDECNHKINSLFAYCINGKNILNDGKNLSSEVYNNIVDNNVFPINTADIENNKIPPIPMFIHDDNDT